MKHIRATGFAIILAAGSLACTNHKLDHNVNVNEPIHIKLDINLVLKKEVEEDLKRDALLQKYLGRVEDPPAAPDKGTRSASMPASWNRLTISRSTLAPLA